MNRVTQKQRIIAYFEEFGSITDYEAQRDLGVRRLSARISEMKKAGVPIISETEIVKNRWGQDCRISRYRLSGDA